jgi:hypothetical protein
MKYAEKRYLSVKNTMMKFIRGNMMARELLKPAGEPCYLETWTQGSEEGSWKSAAR